MKYVDVHVSLSGGIECALLNAARFDGIPMILETASNRIRRLNRF